MLQGLARYHGFVYGVAAVLASRFEPAIAETALLTLAKLYSGTLRTRILHRLTTVESAAGRDWLLTEGYDNGLDYETSVWSAAVLGRMIERLRQPTLPLDDLVHHARTLERMAEMAGMRPGRAARNCSRYRWTAFGRVGSREQPTKRWARSTARCCCRYCSG